MNSFLTAVADYLLRRGRAADQRRAGLVVAAIKLGFGRLEYLQRNGASCAAPQTILMLHGASADRSAWLAMARHLDPRYTLLIPDLPGHGHSGDDAALDYSVAAQAARIKEMLCQMTHGRVHVVANAIGGAIALHLAATWPALVRSLTLIGATGVGEDQADKLARIAAPALLIRGAADQVHSAANDALLQQHLANSERVVLDEIGHAAMVEAPRQVARLCMRFLDQGLSRRA